MNIDRSDYEGDPTQKDEAIKDLVNEIKVLQQLKDTKAKNINLIDAAFPFHSQLWIVSDYCSGGSLYTLVSAAQYSFRRSSHLELIASGLCAI